ncbi:hypothetical protein J7E62_27570 [Variovorax paradoxus]|nr:hypothetical protein [Variovorax paradoxus]
MKTNAIRGGREAAKAELDRIWEQACKHAREVRAQRQRVIEAMLRAGQSQPKREEKSS